MILISGFFYLSFKVLVTLFSSLVETLCAEKFCWKNLYHVIWKCTICVHVLNIFLSIGHSVGEMFTSVSVNHNLTALCESGTNEFGGRLDDPLSPLHWGLYEGSTCSQSFQGNETTRLGEFPAWKFKVKIC